MLTKCRVDTPSTIILVPLIILRRCSLRSRSMRKAKIKGVDTWHSLARHTYSFHRTNINFMYRYSCVSLFLHRTSTFTIKIKRTQLNPTIPFFPSPFFFAPSDQFCIVQVQSGIGSEGTLPDLHQKNSKNNTFHGTTNDYTTQINSLNL